jgi:hypothetical protein
MICHRAAEWSIKTRKDSLMIHAGVPVMDAEQGTSYITTAAPYFDSTYTYFASLGMMDFGIHTQGAGSSNLQRLCASLGFISFVI